jgi:hypothetical protein
MTDFKASMAGDENSFRVFQNLPAFLVLKKISRRQG